MRKLLSTIALAALATAAVHADPGGGKGSGGNGGGKDYGVGKDHGGGPDKGGYEQAKGQDKREGQGKSENRGQSAHRADDRSSGKHADQDRSDDRRVAGTSSGKQDRFDQRGDNDRGRFDRDERADGARMSWRELDRRGLINGCPPGLAKKNNGCMPPGQAKKYGYDRYDANWWGLRGLNNLSGYRYVDGNLVRLTPGGAVLDYYPLLGGALAVGNPWPSAWQPTPLSPYYSNYYGLQNDARYFDGAIYRVNPTTSTIQSLAALLTGDSFNVGQRMPAGYDAYNVPYQYRDRYADGPDANYRYSDGYLYQSDPKTQLIVAAIQLLR